MVLLRFNFDHPFQGKVLLRSIDCGNRWSDMMQFDSQGKHDFDIPLDLPGDGCYHILIDWEHEGRMFFHETTVKVKDGIQVAESTY